MLSFCYHTAKKKGHCISSNRGPHQEKEIRNCLTFHLLERWCKLSTTLIILPYAWVRMVADTIRATQQFLFTLLRLGAFFPRNVHFLCLAIVFIVVLLDLSSIRDTFVSTLLFYFCWSWPLLPALSKTFDHFACRKSFALVLMRKILYELLQNQSFFMSFHNINLILIRSKYSG